MPLTQQQARYLAGFIASIRDDWDEQGVYRILGKVQHERAANVALAAIRAADDPKASTPGVIPTAGPHWTERKGDPEPPRPPRRDEECPAHPGSWQGSCNACRADQLAGDQTPRRTEASPITSEHVRSLRGIYAAAASALCSHGVPQRNCNQHDETKESA